ncbi:glycosyltransferase family 4 protein [Rhodopila sp.]|uniref:glycosyltransferase family 4 protein n=1 Tax=Rhodopila sp. TaxID=2480087 RepID=UPI003D0979FC
MIVPAGLSTISGAAAYDRHMAEGLRALGHAVRVVELAGHFPDPDSTAINAAHAAWAELEADSVAVIEGLALPAFAGLAAALAPRRAIVLVHHPAALETGWPQETHERLRTLETALFQAAPRLVVTSEQTADRLVAEFSADRARIAVIAPGIENPPRSSGSADGDTCMILSVGPLIPRKGHDVLLRALSRLFDLDWHLTIVGSADRDPVHAQGLLALAEECRIAHHVHFTDEIEVTAMETLWQNADLFALASWLEGYGTAMAEALRRGITVAVTATGAAPTLVGPEAGVVCPPGDVGQLSKAMRRLIFDRTLRREMADMAWQSGRSLPSWHEQAMRLAAVLAE